MIEADIERKLKREVERHGAQCLKFVSPGRAGVPDRIILIPGGRICFVELKAPGKHERPLQIHTQEQLRQMGFVVFSSVNSTEKVGAVTEWCAQQIQEASRNGV
ncbi:MAG: VRR-NUC domain-containing protein [Bilifractor sp.]